MMFQRHLFFHLIFQYYILHQKLFLIQVFWVNTHIYFFLGPGLVFFYFINSLVAKKSKKLSLQMLVLISLACFINPNFYKGALYPFFVFKNYGYQIVENQSFVFMSNYVGRIYNPFFAGFL